MRKWLVHVQLLTANGVHPVSDGTAGTLVLQGTKKKRRGKKKKRQRPVIVGPYPTEPYCPVARRSGNTSMDEYKIFWAVLFFLAVGQKLLKC